MKLVESIVDKAGYLQLYLDQYYSPAVASTIAVPWAEENVRAIVLGRYPGDEGGTADELPY